MASVAVSHLSRHFGRVAALDDISFTVADGEFLTLLGPSGCGKSTTLAALAGLDRPTSGTIRIGDKVLFDGAAGIFIDAQFRNLGLMFQSYALWPHMTVAQNLDFTLELRRIRGAEAKQRIDETLALVDMEAYAARYPGELSGGQQQRVALARTLVYRPEMLLLDEPLSNLDAKLRDRARIWLGELQKRTGVTTVYVTHDQSEALALSDRIIVMNKGRIAQIGTPEEIYETPADVFVADFVGASNLLKAELGNDGNARLPSGEVLHLRAGSPSLPPGPVTLAIRPEKIVIAPDVSHRNRVMAEVVAKSYLGARNLLVLRIGEQRIRVETTAPVLTSSIAIELPADAIGVYAAN
jgi:iron(III) transport system ATP-binding protein